MPPGIVSLMWELANIFTLYCDASFTYFSEIVKLVLTLQNINMLKVNKKTLEKGEEDVLS